MLHPGHGLDAAPLHHGEGLALLILAIIFAALLVWRAPNK